LRHFLHHLPFFMPTSHTCGQKITCTAFNAAGRYECIHDVMHNRPTRTTCHIVVGHDTIARSHVACDIDTLQHTTYGCMQNSHNTCHDLNPQQHVTQAEGMRDLMVAAAWTRDCSVTLSNCLLSTWLRGSPIQAREQAKSAAGRLVRTVLPLSSASEDSQTVMHLVHGCVLDNLTMCAAQTSLLQHMLCNSVP
jgi:hypothetical protein